MCPDASVATHNRREGHETPLREKFAPETRVACHVRAPPVGFVETTISALLGPETVAAQKWAVGHEIAISRPPARRMTCHDFALRGVRENITPPGPLAKHSCAVGQLNARTEPTGSRASFQLLAPPVTFLVVIRSPAPFPAAQKRVSGAQASAPNSVSGFAGTPEKLVACHAAAPPPGCLEVTTPSASSATHNRADGHATPRIVPVVAHRDT